MKVEGDELMDDFRESKEGVGGWESRATYMIIVLFLLLTERRIRRKNGGGGQGLSGGEGRRGRRV